MITTFVVILVCWYFFAPIQWTFGLRAPKNYQECLDVGGKLFLFGKGEFQIAELQPRACYYKDQQFDPFYPFNTQLTK